MARKGRRAFMQTAAFSAGSLLTTGGHGPRAAPQGSETRTFRFEITGLSMLMLNQQLATPTGQDQALTGPVHILALDGHHSLGKVETHRAVMMLPITALEKPETADPEPKKIFKIGGVTYGLWEIDKKAVSISGPADDKLMTPRPAPSGEPCPNDAEWESLDRLVNMHDLASSSAKVQRKWISSFGAEVRGSVALHHGRLTCVKPGYPWDQVTWKVGANVVRPLSDVIAFSVRDGFTLHVGGKQLKFKSLDRRLPSRAFISNMPRELEAPMPGEERKLSHFLAFHKVLTIKDGTTIPETAEECRDRARVQSGQAVPLFPRQIDPIYCPPPWGEGE